MSLYRRRRRQKTLDFNDVTLTMKNFGHIFAHHPTDPMVIRPDEGRIISTVRLSVEENNRDSLMRGTVDGSSNGVHLVG